MGAKYYVVDSGGVTRKVKKFHVVDSGGVTRTLKKAYVVDASGATRLYFTSADDFTLVVGTEPLGGEGRGYAQGGFGNITPSPVLGDGTTIVDLLIGNNTHILNLSIAGFPSNPGAGYVATLVINGTTTFLGSAATYSYSGGQATWQWSGAGRFTAGTSVGCEITHG
jgi:hypothetical protein